MNYFVEWEPDALDGLSAAWLAIADKASVNDAEAEITQRLARDPLAVGSAKPEGLRRIDVPPLVAYYSIDLPSRVVKVLQLGYVVRPSP